MKKEEGKVSFTKEQHQKRKKEFMYLWSFESAATERGWGSEKKKKRNCQDERARKT
jgi:hypothetical protein